jgi:DNA-binding MarR family transcriptional regulator
VDASAFDPLLLSQVRLGVIAVLVERGAATFPELKQLLAVTQGNLGIHLRKLEDGGYVEVEKDFADRKPRTTARLTPAGRAAFLSHVDRLGRIARGDSE